MIRFILRIDERSADGRETVRYRTVDVDVPELETQLTIGGYGEGYWELASLAGVELIDAAREREGE